MPESDVVDSTDEIPRPPRDGTPTAIGREPELLDPELNGRAFVATVDRRGRTGEQPVFERPVRRTGRHD